MDELLQKLWPYFERAGAVAAVILSVVVSFLLKDRTRILGELKDERARKDAIQEQRIEDGREVSRVMEQNNAASKANADVLRDALAELHRRKS